MTLSTWWLNDSLPPLRPLSGFTVSRFEDERTLAQLNRISLKEVRTRRAAGHLPYGAYLHGVPVSYGWVATRQASIGELDLSFPIPASDRYLWDFATLPAWRGHGLYPRLLQGILRAEQGDAKRFWIIHAPENLPSGSGMCKAGFLPVGELSFDAAGAVTFASLGDQERAEAGAALLKIPLADTELSPCWHCGSGDGTCGCAPAEVEEVGSCACAVTIKPGRASTA